MSRTTSKVLTLVGALAVPVLLAVGAQAIAVRPGAPKVDTVPIHVTVTPSPLPSASTEPAPTIPEPPASEQPPSVPQPPPAQGDEGVPVIPAPDDGDDDGEGGGDDDE